ncbi:MAG: nitrophenyl compound nitroreductase subunit ArsF family protein [bacterium]
MKPRAIFRAVLLLFVVVSLATLVADEMRRGAASNSESLPTTVKEETLPQTQTDSGGKVVVTYYHGFARCPSCLAIEAYTKEAVETGFPDALGSGRLEWRTVNCDEYGNEHFVYDYSLYTKSVVVSERLDEEEVRWKNLERVWELLSDREAFRAYIQSEVRAYLDGQ